MLDTFLVCFYSNGKQRMLARNARKGNCPFMEENTSEIEKHNAAQNSILSLRHIPDPDFNGHPFSSYAHSFSFALAIFHYYD